MKKRDYIKVRKLRALCEVALALITRAVEMGSLESTPNLKADVEKWIADYATIRKDEIPSARRKKSKLRA